jgi:Flp pilus assembly pilin Flp
VAARALRVGAARAIDAREHVPHRDAVLPRSAGARRDLDDVGARARSERAERKTDEQSVGDSHGAASTPSALPLFPASPSQVDSAWRIQAPPDHATLAQSSGAFGSQIGSDHAIHRENGQNGAGTRVALGVGRRCDANASRLSRRRTKETATMMKTRRIRSLLADTRGLSTVEYIIILCLIAVVGFAIWQKFGNTVKTKTRGAESVVNGLPTSSTP